MKKLKLSFLNCWTRQFVGKYYITVLLLGRYMCLPSEPATHDDVVYFITICNFSLSLTIISKP